MAGTGEIDRERPPTCRDFDRSNMRNCQKTAKRLEWVTQRGCGLGHIPYQA